MKHNCKWTWVIESMQSWCLKSFHRTWKPIGLYWIASQVPIKRVRDVMRKTCPLRLELAADFPTYQPTAELRSKKKKIRIKYLWCHPLSEVSLTISWRVIVSLDWFIDWRANPSLSDWLSRFWLWSEDSFRTPSESPAKQARSIKILPLPMLMLLDWLFWEGLRILSASPRESQTVHWTSTILFLFLSFF